MLYNSWEDYYESLLFHLFLFLRPIIRYTPLYLYFIAEGIHLIAWKNALYGMVNITKTDTSQPENDLNLISRLSKACWR